VPGALGTPLNAELNALLMLFITPPNVSRKLLPDDPPDDPAVCVTPGTPVLLPPVFLKA
jgi:hypothetical protein